MADILKMLEMFERNHEFAPAAQRDLDEIIAELRATPPADAALADRITPSLIIHYGQVQHENDKLREEIAALRARAVPDCVTCVNRGRVRGLSQDTYCEDCIFGTPYKLNHYASKSGDGKGGE